MSPSLVPGDEVLTRRLHRARRGQVVFFPHPARDDFWLVKRVLGLAHETISIRAGLVHADGVPVPDPWSSGPTAPDGVWQVPPGHMFVLSDARARTLADSRTLGAVPISPGYEKILRYRRGTRRP